MPHPTILLAGALLAASASLVAAEDAAPASEPTADAPVAEVVDEDAGTDPAEPSRNDEMTAEEAEGAYRAEAEAWYADWRARPSQRSRKPDDCIAAYAAGEKIRDEMQATTPPPRYAKYHELLLTYADDSLAVADECLLKPGGGPKYFAKSKKRDISMFAIRAVVREERLDLPRRW